MNIWWVTYANMTKSIISVIYNIIRHVPFIYIHVSIMLFSGLSKSGYGFFARPIERSFSTNVSNVVDVTS